MEPLPFPDLDFPELFDAASAVLAGAGCVGDETGCGAAFDCEAGVAGAGVASIIAFINASLALAFFRRTMSSALKSNDWPLLWIFSMMRSSEMPASSMEITPSTVNPGFAVDPAVGPEPDGGFATL